MTKAALLPAGGANQEARLARAAAGGNARAFVTLYCTYEQRVFNLALRITGSPEAAADAARQAFPDALRALSQLEGAGRGFGACLLTAARNAGHEFLRDRAAGEDASGGNAPREGAAEADEYPGHGAAEGLAASGGDDDFAAEQQRIREAAMRLAPSEREVLALGGLDDLSYGEIAAVTDSEPGAVAELTALARIGLHDGLTGEDPRTTAPRSDDCDQALPLMAMRDDGQLEDPEDFGWLLDHLAHCGGCRLRLDAMEAAAAAYERWEPAAPPPGLFGETVAAAAGVVGADWSEVAGELAPRRRAGAVRGTLPGVCKPSPGGVRRAPLARVGPVVTGLPPAVTGAGDAATEALGSVRETASRLASDAWRRRPRRNGLVTAGLLLLVLLGLSSMAAGAALVLSGEEHPEPAAGPPAEGAPGAGRAPSSAQVFPARPRVSRPAKPKRQRRSRRRMVVVMQRPARETPKPAAEPQPRRAPRRTPEARAVPLPEPNPSPPAAQPLPTQPPAAAPPQPPQAPPLQIPGCTNAPGSPCPG